ncbi:MAG: cytochrome c peroxidase [Pseudomonadota bacterium]
MIRLCCVVVLLAGTASADMPDLGPKPKFEDPDFDRVLLGQALFYDPILSGNRNISCGTCHHPKFGTSDGVSLSLGEGGIGLGPDRQVDPDNPPEQRIPRNSPALWNLGAAEFDVLFHDGRLEADPNEPNGLRTPLGHDMTLGFDSVLSAQSMFPVLSPDEMAGHYSENEISRAVRQGFLSQPGGAWDLLAARVAAIPDYAQKLKEARRPGEAEGFPLIANVIADFIRFEWRADNSLFDKAMRDEAELPALAQSGQTLFYGTAGCAACHSGWFQTDHRFHAIALPQIGPGKAARFESHSRDDGRLRVTGDQADRFAFRTPSLRNVALTAPYGHNGAYSDLADMIRHHGDPVGALHSYDISLAALPELATANDAAVLRDPVEMQRIAAANSLAPVALSDFEISALIAFLETLTDNARRLGVPESVPSGLPVDH